MRPRQATYAYTLLALLGLLFIGPLSVPASAVKVSPPFTGLKTDIPIGEIDGVLLSINIALPKGSSDTRYPVFVRMHGGGFIKGDKNQLNKQMLAMSKKGVVAASVMYRLAPQHRFPAQLEDVKLAIRFLKAHAEEFNLDPERIIVAGSSAGGYLATMVGVTGNSTEFSKHGLYEEYDSTVRGVIAQSPPIADFSLPEHQSFVGVERLIDTNQQNWQEMLARISPVTYLDKADPAFFFSHGTADTVVPVDMTREFVQLLKQVDHPHIYMEVEGGGHSLSRTRPKEASRVFKASMAFFDELSRAQ